MLKAIDLDSHDTIHVAILPPSSANRQFTKHAALVWKLSTVVVENQVKWHRPEAGIAMANMIGSRAGKSRIANKTQCPMACRQLWSVAKRTFIRSNIERVQYFPPRVRHASFNSPLANLMPCLTLSKDNAQPCA